jgi:Domain of unknown function (DUF4430)
MGRLGTVARSCLAALLAAAALAGCGGAGSGDGTATLWITRDRGSTVLTTASVPAGLTVMQALDREADVDTRYGGRFVQAVNGLEGSASRGWDWFYFVNGVAADRGAAEYRLRAGEVAWWDYRRWRGRREEVVVVGAFPEPFVHGYAGKTRPVAVRYERPSQRPTARRVARVVGARSVAPDATAVPDGVNVVSVVDGSPRLMTTTAQSPSGPYTLTLSDAAARRLLVRPALARYRYEGLP